LRVQIPRKAYLSRLLFSRAGKVIAGVMAFFVLTAGGLFTYAWVHYSRIIDQKLKEGPFARTAMLYAAPEALSVGDRISPGELATALKSRGYTESRSNRMGWYHVRADAVEFFPGVDSYARSEPAVVFIQEGIITRILSSRDHTDRYQIGLEPELFTNLFDRARQKRRVIRFGDVPQVLVNAILSAEDKRFFSHAGFDPIRLIRTIWVDVTQNRRYGASTISMQLARTIWLDQEKTWKRKAVEALITLQIEQKLTKEEIFEHYVNSVDLGMRRSFAVRGFGEAAQVYLGKDVRQLNVEEAAMLAGLIQRPNYLNPYRHPERARNRRNIVLGLMRDNGFINEVDYHKSTSAPIALAEGGVESTDAPYFVDLIHDTLQEQFQEIDFQAESYRIYTTVDMKLQRDAIAAIQAGMKEVDEQLARRKRQYPRPQVALVALDPKTGEVKALVGGRSYGESQLNRALARRQPGSIFKPFVYASVLRSAVDGSPHLITPVSTVEDEPTTFYFDDKTYEPNNFKMEFHGLVNLRQALSKSMNIPTVKFAEMAGYDAVAELARDAGLSGVRGTPALALGAYEVTPLDMAAAYTVFSNGGVWTKHNFIREIRSESGGRIFEYKPVTRQVLDPRISYMVVDLMQEVLRSGTGAGARSRGFGLPAAGKTGTSHDAWFAGFTTKLLCIVWVGFDNNQELPLEGSKAALPIWTEFMKRAHQYREYRGVQAFQPPDGITTVDIDPLTGQLATAACPRPRAEVFVAGTQPVEFCRLHGGAGQRTQIAAWDNEPAEAQPDVSAASDAQAPRAARVARRSPQQEPQPAAAPKPQPEAPKRGFLDRIRAIFR
jgi:penicillin-binding protein 1B